MVAVLRLVSVVFVLACWGAGEARAQFSASLSDEDDADDDLDLIEREFSECDEPVQCAASDGGDGNTDRSLLMTKLLRRVPDKSWLTALRLDAANQAGQALADAARYVLFGKTVYFSGFDAWRAGGTAYGGFLYAANGENIDGFIFKGLVADGAYAYRSGRRVIRGVYTLASAMPGWRLSYGTFEVKAYAGLDLQSHRLVPYDRFNRLRGSHVGARFGTDIWWEPLPQAMVASSLSGSTIGQSFRARVATGIRFSNLFWAGPEAEFGRDDAYRQTRVGVHLTSFRFSAIDWSVGAGFLSDSDRRSGYYGRLGLAVRIDPVDHRRFPKF